MSQYNKKTNLTTFLLTYQLREETRVFLAKSETTFIYRECSSRSGRNFNRNLTVGYLLLKLLFLIFIHFNY